MARTPPSSRVRRDPEAAKELILASAARVFAERGPDAAGLKDVARGAGVSHALVSHYFGTYEALVEAVLERRVEAIRRGVFADLVDPIEDIHPRALLERLRVHVGDPATSRLVAWALLSGRAEGAQFFTRRVQGLRLVADAIEPRLKRRHGRRLTRADVEFAILAALSFTYGLALAGSSLHASLGREATPDSERALFDRFAHMLELYFDRPRETTSPRRA
jgi:TetR/AcrR family transcriptional regulator, repressor for neighboring sulfatase